MSCHSSQGYTPGGAALRQTKCLPQRQSAGEGMCRGTFAVTSASAANAGEQQDPEQAVTASAVTEAVQAEQSVIAASAAVVVSASAAGAKDQ